MKARSEVFRWQPVVLFLGSALLFLVAHFVSHKYEWTALDVPFKPNSNGTLSARFEVDQNASYYVDFVVERNLPFDTLVCLLGMNNRLDPCAVEPVVNMQWVVRNQSTIVGSGKSGPQTADRYGQTISRGLGHFDAVPNISYRLELTSSTNTDALKLTNPRIKVRVHPSNYKSNFVYGYAISWFAVVLAAISVLWFLFLAIRFYIRRGKA